MDPGGLDQGVCSPWRVHTASRYPPALKKLIAKRKNFSQLEDFNRKQALRTWFRIRTPVLRRGQSVVGHRKWEAPGG